MKLNIGCGYDKLDGYINIDISKDVNPDKVVNIEKGLPFNTNSVDEIYSCHCLEHIRPEKWRYVLKEIARVCKNNTIITLDLPFDNAGTRTHFDHYRTFTYGSFQELREYYLDGVRFETLEHEDNKLLRIFYLLFPFFKSSIRIKLKVIKEKK
jgi:SAM-dependent methyltransferase